MESFLSETDEKRRADLPAELRRLYPTLMALARVRLRDDHNAQDAVQETVTRALQGWDSYRPEAPIARWVFTIAANVIRDMGRRKRTRKEHPPIAGEATLLDPGGALERTEDVGRILRCMQDLDATDRVPLLLHLVHGLPQKEIADVMDLSVEHLRVRLYRGIRKIRRAMGIEE